MSTDRPDPNKERNDPMVAEYWQLGEDLQDAILSTGYQSPTVEGIAVDVHDLLQAVERLRTELIPAAIAEPSRANLDAISAELDHMRWHCDAGETFLAEARSSLDPA